MAADVGKALARGLLSLVVPVFQEPIPFGPRPPREVLLALFVMTSVCFAAGTLLTKSPLLLRLASKWHTELREEAWEQLETSKEAKEAEALADEEARGAKAQNTRKRTAAELLFIAVHNGSVCVLAGLAWMLQSPSLALYAFTLEVGYEVFDTYSLRLRRLEPETLIHHVVSPICILCSTQTSVDFRVLVHLCICIDASGAVLGYAKFLLHYAHVSANKVYRRLMYVHGVLRVALTLVDTAIIMHKEIKDRGGLFAVGGVVDGEGRYLAFEQTDWTQLYFWAMAVLNAFNVYFFFVIRARASMPAHVIASFEARTGCH